MLVLAWFAIVGIGLVVYAGAGRELRLPVLGTFAAILVGTVAIGYWTGFRDMIVDEDVVMAATRAPAARARARRSRRRRAPARAGEPPSRRSPVELASGAFAGADGHAGTGIATVVEQPDGERLLTFTEFDVDPGVDVDVYLSAERRGRSTTGSSSAT